MSTALVFVTLLLTTLIGWRLLSRHRLERARILSELARHRKAVTDHPEPRLASSVPSRALRDRFARERIIVIDDFLDRESLAEMQQECLRSGNMVERSYIPGHKKGGTLSYEAVHRHAPNCLAFYHSSALREHLGQIVGTAIETTPDHDQSSCSLLYYDRPGDHIGWHYDYNFYRGRHFTVLLSLFNRAEQEQSGSSPTSTGNLQCKKNGRLSTLPTVENSLVIFEGQRVFHRATAVSENQLRVMLSMTFCTDPRTNRLKELARRLKDTAYFGTRVLFD